MRNIFMKFILATNRQKKTKILIRHAESRTGVAALAVFEGEVAAEGTLAVVTGQTGRAAGCDEVLCWGGRADLARL
jgi:hypothetical protein